jgi:hypothetical protein
VGDVISALSFSKVDRNELPEWTAAGRPPVDLGRRCRLFATDLQRIAVDFGKWQDFAAHFDRDCGGLWQGKSLYFNGTRCSRLWKMTRREEAHNGAKTRLTGKPAWRSKPRHRLPNRVIERSPPENISEPAEGV